MPFAAVNNQRAASTVHSCPTCSGSMAGRRGNARYCSRDCGEVARGQRLSAPLPRRLCALPGCNVQFQPRRDSTRCCSEAHGKQLWNREARRRGYYTDRVELTCHVCGSAVERRRSAKWDGHQRTCRNGMCNSFVRLGHWPRTDLPARHPVVRRYEVELWRPRRKTTRWTLRGPRFVGCTCRTCGDRYLFDRARSFGAQPTSQFCSERCGRKWNKHQRRLAESASHEVVIPTVVYERDRWRCGVCRKAVKRGASAPHPLAPTLDHVVPVIEGGDHTYANIRTAHFICNSRRGNRGGGEQLSLIG